MVPRWLALRPRKGQAKWPLRGGASCRSSSSAPEAPSDRNHPIYTQEHFALRASLRKIIDKEINPFVDKWEEEGQFPAHQVFKTLGKAGFFGVNKPIESLDQFHLLHTGKTVSECSPKKGVTLFMITALSVEKHVSEPGNLTSHEPGRSEPRKHTLSGNTE